jgi:hypothetical protein
MPAMGSSGIADLTNASVIGPRDPCSKLGVDKMVSGSVCEGFQFKFIWG